MSCAEGEPCQEARYRNVALLVLALMTLIFLGLSVLSFTKSRGQVTPDTVTFASYNAVDGKRVFEAYNCMGCHTMVGNGAYLGPDLTGVYAHVGPAWLAAMLPSAGTWPTGAAVRTQLQVMGEHIDGDDKSFEAYVRTYPGVSDRIERRGGKRTTMPNLPLSPQEIGQLTAYFKYTSMMNTEGWPPKPKVDGHAVRSARAAGAARPATAGAAMLASAPASAPENAATRGAALVAEYACTACHSIANERLIAPAWAGLYDSQVKLADGTPVLADDAYLTESITQPDAKIVEGYAASMMPSYSALLKAEDVDAIVAYIRSLKGNGR